jgi:hypothetical protein
LHTDQIHQNAKKKKRKKKEKKKKERDLTEKMEEIAYLNK